MKYIKTFETNYRFKIGEYVKHVDQPNKNDMYQIKGIAKRRLNLALTSNKFNL